MNEFNIEELIESLGLNYENRLQPYNYERYRLFNPQLSENMYLFLRNNSCEWKILCGLRVTMDWSNDVLEPIAHLKSDIVPYTEYFEYKNRFSPENYLSENYW